MVSWLPTQGRIYYTGQNSMWAQSWNSADSNVVSFMVNLRSWAFFPNAGAATSFQYKGPICQELRNLEQGRKVRDDIQLRVIY